MRTGSIELADKAISRQQEQANSAGTKKGSFVEPVILYFYDGMKVRVRPLGDFNSCPIASKHYKYSSERSQIIDNLCAKEAKPAQPCGLCEQATAQKDKKLEARDYWYLPVYVYGIWRTKDRQSNERLDSPQRVTTKDEGGNEKPVTGFRFLEFNGAYGAFGSVYVYFDELMHDSSAGSLLDWQFEIKQAGSGKGNKKFLVERFGPSKIEEKLVRKTPSRASMEEKILKARPPVVSNGMPLAGDIDLDDPDENLDSNGQLYVEDEEEIDLDDHPF